MLVIASIIPLAPLQRWAEVASFLHAPFVEGKEARESNWAGMSRGAAVQVQPVELARQLRHATS